MTGQILKLFSRYRFMLTTAVLALLFAGGCGERRESEVASIKVIQGDEQCAPPNSTCPKELRFELLGPKRKGFLMGKGSVSPVPDVRVRFEALPGSDLSVVCDKPVSDAGGMVKATIKTGAKFGDQYLKIIPTGFDAAAKTVRVVSGVELQGMGQEAFAGEFLKNPIRLRVFGNDGKPVAGVPVFFKITSTPSKKSGAKLSSAKVVTDKTGTAQTLMKVGDTTGTYHLTAEVAAPDKGLAARGVDIKELGINLWGAKGLILIVLGGLAIFIYGMKLMTDGLQLVAGDKMKQVLYFFTKNRVAAVFAGAVVTGVIQSSSACTVMVVGFVNAGLLSLRQAIGVVFGANIGTTVTAQIISFKLHTIALPCITAGLIIMMLSKKASWKGVASAIMGFGMLFFGLHIMSHELKLIANFPSIINFFKQFDCSPVTTGGAMPLGAVLGAVAIGTLMTVVIQSSSATIGIALALASSNLINFYTAVPLILGDNIGTTVTANLAALGANRRSKQAALAHFLFNIFGTTYMILLFYVPYHGVPIYLYVIDSITPGDVFAGENISRHIAMAHTAFNVFNVLLFLPLITPVAKVCEWLIPVSEGKETISLLEPRLLDTPALAIEQTIKTIRHMAKEAWKMNVEAVEHVFMKGKAGNKRAQELAEREESMDQLQAEATEYLAKLTERPLTEPQAAIIPLLMHCVNDAEKIADRAENVIALARRAKSSKRPLSDSAMAELANMWSVLKQQASHVISSIDSTDKKGVNLAIKDEKTINKLADKLEDNHIARLGKGKCHPVPGIIFLEMVSELEKIGDGLANIAERVPEIQKHHLAIGK